MAETSRTRYGRSHREDIFYSVFGGAASQWWFGFHCFNTVAYPASPMPSPLGLIQAKDNSHGIGHGCSSIALYHEMRDAGVLKRAK